MLAEMMKLATKENLTEQEARKIYEWKKTFRSPIYDEMHTAHEIFSKAFHSFPNLYDEYYPLPKSTGIQHEEKRLDAYVNVNDLGIGYVQSMNKARKYKGK